ncbi:hypothetical protein FQA39_LY01060 [Lamprigera yunnana]|nr:hypothetical protein FQA39_LY01060 [Lamprigera yunnana]
MTSDEVCEMSQERVRENGARGKPYDLPRQYGDFAPLEGGPGYFIGCGQVEFLKIVLVNANDNGLGTSPAELKCMDATVSAPICIVYTNLILVYLDIYL